MQKFLIISLGAIIGANLRYWIGGWIARIFGASYPWGTLIINLSGSFILGLFLTLITERFFIDPRWRTLVGIGLLGSYTTFSTYTFESVSLILGGQYWAGFLNLFGSAFAGGIMMLFGIYLGKLL
ncbi:MAG: fluoride efflux transporter CrcB [Anaerolineae bacterium]|nr:fluoride efflux transporter CrcB [Anaerolineae bacterium]